METSRRRGLAERFLHSLTQCLRVLEAGEGRRAAKEPLWKRLSKNGRGDTKLVQDALHLLYTRLNGKAAAKKELRSCWPITESSQHKEFKVAMHAWVRALAAAGRLPPQAAQYFVTAYQTWGLRTTELLFHLAVLALEAELDRRHPDLLTSTAPAMQDAAPAAYELASAEDRHRRQAEEQRLGEVLAVLARVQQLFVESARGLGEGVRHLQPWWSTSQAHVDKVQTVQQLLEAGPPSSFSPEEAGGMLGPLLRPNTAAASRAGAHNAAGDQGPVLGDANPAAVLQVLAMRTVPVGQPRDEDGQAAMPLGLAAISSRAASRRFYTRAVLLEAERGMQLCTAAEPCPAPAHESASPCSVLRFQPSSPPRRNPVQEATNTLTLGQAEGLDWDSVLAGSDAAAAINKARQGVWAAVCSRQPVASPPTVQPMAAAPSPAGAGPISLPVLALTPLPALQLRGAGEQYCEPGESRGQATASDRWCSRLHSAPLPSPTLASMIELAAASPFLFSPAGSEHGGSRASSGGACGMDGFSLPPSLTPTPRWSAAEQSEPGRTEGGAVARQQQPESPCFAESIASFSVAAGGAGSAAEARAQQHGRQHWGRASQRAGGLGPVGEGPLSPTASAAASAVPTGGSWQAGGSCAGSLPAPAATEQEQQADRADSPHGGLAHSRQKAASLQVSVPAQLPDADSEAATPESKAAGRQPTADVGERDLGGCSSHTAGAVDGASGLHHVPGISPPKALGESPFREGTIPAHRPGADVHTSTRQSSSQGPAAAASAAALREKLSRFSRGPEQRPAQAAPVVPAAEVAGKPAAGGEVGRRHAACVVTTSSPTKIKPLHLAAPAPGGSRVRHAALEGSPGLSQVSLYSPPKALASPAPAGSWSQAGSATATLQDLSNACHSPPPGPDKSSKDKGGLLLMQQRFERLKLRQKP